MVNFDLVVVSTLAVLKLLLCSPNDNDNDNDDDDDDDDDDDNDDDNDDIDNLSACSQLPSIDQ